MKAKTMKEIGITTTVPIEVLLAAGYKPVDLNNVFIGDPAPHRLVDIAERFGFPQNCCVWIKGIFGVCLGHNIDTVLCVTTGDCSNTIMLMEVLKLKGFNAIPFAYPSNPDIQQMQRSLQALAETLGTTLEAAEEIRDKLASCRRLTAELDELTWKEGLASGWENHSWLVSGSDFNGDYHNYVQRLDQFLKECRKRQPYPRDMLRLAYIGVPPVFARDLFHFVEQQGARVVFNEIQRQFTMPQPGNSLAEQYAAYTYPYSIFDRLQDILPELRHRQVDGIIHYVQTFCHRGIGDIIFRHSIDMPILTLEGNDEFILTQHLQTKIEAFLDVLRRSQSLLNKVGDAMKGSLYGFCS
jgi:benzoyl-CoA reductase/2-hydroxyglutaryl-CoA dehydratase subunit BcrC/BadD/HgdB